MPDSKHQKKLKIGSRPKVAVGVFALMLFYFIGFVIMYLTRSQVQVYEVQPGSVAYTSTFTGMALREESVVTSDYSGTFNIYQHEGNRVKAGDIVCTVDERGTVAQELAQYTENASSQLTSSDISQMVTLINAYRTDYSTTGFSGLSTLRSSLNSVILGAVTSQIEENLDSILAQTNAGDSFKRLTADQAGYVVYTTDGYESVTEDTFTAQSFNTESYARQRTENNETIESGDAAYKLITSENWYLIVPLSDDQISANQLQNKSAVTVDFLKDNIETTANFEIIERDGQNYGKISLNKYMIRYCTDRFLNIRLVTSRPSGLKVPVSAVVQKSYFSIPASYITQGGANGDEGFITQTKDTSGNMVQMFVSPTIIRDPNDEDTVYVSRDELQEGTSLLAPDSDAQYVIGPTGTVNGVYVINTGYTVFEPIYILDKSDEYVICDTDKSSLSAYDRIVLKASGYKEGDVVY